MNITELTNVVAERTGQRPAQVRETLDATLYEIGARVAADEEVSLSGFGSFEPRQRAARTAKNPRTGELIEIPANRALVFRAFTALKTRVRG